MKQNSTDAMKSAFGRRGCPDPPPWKSVQELLFLEQGHSLSRVEAYPAETLVPARKILASAREDALANVNPESRLSAPATPPLGKYVEVIELEVKKVVSLRNPKDVTEYLKKTSKFRAFFIRQKYSWGPLLVTSHLFEELMLCISIPSRFKGFVVFFGGREREVEISPPILRFARLSLTQGAHECMYGLRFVEENGRSDSDKPSRGWSLRQAAICCRYVPGEDGASWLFVTVSHAMQQRLDSYVAESSDLDDSDPFEIHFLAIDYAIKSWRQYLVDLSAETDGQYSQLLGTSATDEGPVDLHETDRRQELMILDDKLLNALLAIRSTADTVSALVAGWESLTELSEARSAFYTELVRTSFDDHNRDLKLLTFQIESLRSKLVGVTSLLSSFLDLSSGSSLQNLVKESGKENEEMRRLSERMHKLAEKSTQDAAAVKVLTILTLIYLPVTVVSNFYSTAFVNATGSGNIVIYDDWWILLAVSIPLTLLTLYVWVVWTCIQANSRKVPWWYYPLGIALFNGRPKTKAGNGISEKVGNDVNDALDCRRSVAEEYPVRMLPRTSSTLC